MCLKISKTPVVALIVSMYLEMSVRNGICDDRKLGAYANPDKASSGSDQTLKSRHIHSWNGWDDWIPPTPPNSYPHVHVYNKNDKPKPQQSNSNIIVPLIAKPSSASSPLTNRTAKNLERKSSNKNEKPTGKQSNKPRLDEEDALSGVRKHGLNFAMSLVRQLISSWTSGSRSSSGHSQNTRNSRTVYLDNLGDRQDGANFGMPEKESNRGVIDWLSRLIGVQGKTLGEFLREYQVHVLYDLAFTFFKWIFFLYAGLLIP